MGDTNSNSILLLLIIVVVTAIIIICYKLFKDEYIETYDDGIKRIQVGMNSYKVHDNLDNKHSAAELMDKINRHAKKIIYHLNDSFINHKDGYNNIKDEYKDRVITGITKLNTNFKTENLIENLPNKIDKDTSYVIDKGDVFALCIRDVNNENALTIDFNEIMFVLVHEMSHIFTISYGHELDFWANFRFILNETYKLGLYTPINYKEIKKPYCGIQISYSPLYDNDLPNYLYSGNFD